MPPTGAVSVKLYVPLPSRSTCVQAPVVPFWNANMTGKLLQKRKATFVAAPAGAVVVSVNVAGWMVTPAAVPESVIVDVPAAVPAGTVKVMVDVPVVLGF